MSCVFILCQFIIANNQFSQPSCFQGRNECFNVNHFQATIAILLAYDFLFDSTSAFPDEAIKYFINLFHNLIIRIWE